MDVCVFSGVSEQSLPSVSPFFHLLSPVSPFLMHAWMILWLIQDQRMAEVTCRSHLCSRRSPWDNCPGPIPYGLWVSAWMETPHLFWATCASAHSCSYQKKKKVLIDVQKRPLLFYFVPSALSCHWVPSEVSDCLLGMLPSGIWWDPSLCVTFLVCYPCFIDLTCLIVKEDLFLRLSNSVICLFFFFNFN